MRLTILYGVAHQIGDRWPSIVPEFAVGETASNSRKNGTLSSAIEFRPKGPSHFASLPMGWQILPDFRVFSVVFVLVVLPILTI